MTDLDLSAMTTARAALQAQQDQVRQARIAAADTALSLAEAQQRGDSAAALQFGAKAAQDDQRLAASLRAVRESGDAIRVRADELIKAIDPEAAVTSLSGVHPVLMLPVRLETRFFDAGMTLKVRIFPDQAHVTAHDPALTVDEIAGLRWYWTHRWASRDAATDPGRTLAEEAWAQLSGQLGPGRGAFLVRTYPPVNLGSADAAPIWGDLPTRSGQWSAAARAALLPDRWCVLGFRRDGEAQHTEIFRVWGNAVPDTLAAGPTPDPTAPTTPGGLPGDPDLLWLTDAVEAQRLGMLVTVRQQDLITGAALSAGVDRLVVLGVDWTLDPAAASAAVDAHLSAHANEGRLGFVPQGAPSNSSGTARSAYSTDIAAAQLVLAPHLPPVTAPGAAGPQTAAALGIPLGLLGSAAGSALREADWQQALLDATWSATGGYYVTEMLDPVADDPAIEASLRHHVTHFLRAGGPLPTLRIGAQPYGLLPVTPPEAFEPDVRRRAQGDIQRVASALRELVAPLVADVPRISKVTRSEDVDDMLLALLQRTPVAWSLTYRKQIGPIERTAVSVWWDAVAAFQREVTAMLLARLRVYELTLLSELTHDDQDHPLHVPLVSKPDPTPADPKRTSTAYLSEIQSLLIDPAGSDILDARQNSVALLEALAAASGVIENRKAGKRIVAAQAQVLQLSPEFTAYARRQSEKLPYMLRVETAVAPPVATGTDVPIPSTSREFATMAFPAITGTQTIAQFVGTQLSKQIDIPGALDSPDDPLHQLGLTAAALGTLAEAPADQLEWAFRGVLDLYSTRLDAWITSLATARLSEHRAATPTGIHLGGWGFIEDLRPDQGTASDSLGFVHAPSIAQAASTAVLRSARQTHRDEQGRLFDLDLSSRRVRQALRILEGIGNGQRLAALLGYRIERGLQDRDLSLAQWILPLRQLCPLRSDRPEDPDQAEPVESVAARDVVDGLALLARWAADRAGLLAAARINAADARTGVTAVLDDVAGLADAVSDVLVAEAVHQATSGNLERSGAALAAHDRQEPAPDPEFVRTPRDGAVVTHRVGVWLDRNAVAPATGWASDVRSIAEPRLDRWLGMVLGDPSGWAVGASIIHPPAPDADGVVPPDAQPKATPLPALRLDTLGLSALSLVLAARRPGAGASTELEMVIGAHLSRTPEAIAAAAGPADRLDIDLESLSLLLDLTAWAADVVGAMPLRGEHLASSTDVSGTRGPVVTVDVAEAVARAASVRATIEKLVSRLKDSISAYEQDPSPVNEGRLLDSLLALVPVEGPDALPTAPDTTITEHAVGLVERVSLRLKAAQSVPTPAAPVVEPGDLPTPGTGEDGELVQARGVVRVLLGNGQPLLPVLTPTDPEPFTAALTGRKDLLGGDGTAAVTWLHRSALVRPQLDALSALLVNAEADGADVAGDLAVLQSPHRPGSPWLALPYDASGPPPVGSAGMVWHAPDGLNPTSGGAGLLVDTWTEAIPASEQTTAVTFHFDAPGARAPQAMLLAVHPAREPDRWDFGTLLACVNEAADLAHLRTVGTTELAPFSTFLPALFLPEAYTRDAPGVRYHELAANAAKLEAGGLVGAYIIGRK